MYRQSTNVQAVTASTKYGRAQSKVKWIISHECQQRAHIIRLYVTLYMYTCNYTRHLA